MRPMRPTGRIIERNYAGPRLCHRCGKVQKGKGMLVSMNPALGEYNPDLCFWCIRLLADVAEQTHSLMLIRWERDFLAPRTAAR